MKTITETEENGIITLHQERIKITDLIAIREKRELILSDEHVQTKPWQVVKLVLR
jgi:hypothetical protein